MGGVKSGKTSTAWTGGIPTMPWVAGLKDPSPRHVGQLQMRPKDPKTAMVLYKRHCQGLATKLANISQLAQFKLQVTHHL